MDAIQFLEREHRNAEGAFGRLLEATPRERGTIWSGLKPGLREHEEIEEQLLYGPLARDAASDPILAEWAFAHHQREVGQVERLIEQTESLDPGVERWLVTVRQIRSELESHIRQQEREIFPRIGRAWDRARLEEAGRDMSERKSSKGGRRV
jgi:iron-sulfur cluster repair protein YtfE (RIC family)